MSEKMTLRSLAGTNASLNGVVNDFEAGRLANAYLFSGENGIGKRTFANLLAKGLVCDAVSLRPCGECKGCRRFDAQKHPDVIRVLPLPKEKTIKIDSLRDMIASLSARSVEGKKRVILIENAERMTPQAQNCLLKTLEETPEGTYFLMTAEAERALLPTVRSRCCVIRMHEWTEDRITEVLRKSVDEKTARITSPLCEGSIGRALEMVSSKDWQQDVEFVRKYILSVRNTADIAESVSRLKDRKDDADRILDLLEGIVSLQIRNPGNILCPDGWEKAPRSGAENILSYIMQAKKMRAANVSWSAYSENLLQMISEERNKW